MGTMQMMPPLMYCALHYRSTLCCGELLKLHWQSSPGNIKQFSSELSAWPAVFAVSIGSSVVALFYGCSVHLKHASAFICTIPNHHFTDKITSESSHRIGTYLFLKWVFMCSASETCSDGALTLAQWLNRRGPQIASPWLVLCPLTTIP